MAYKIRQLTKKDKGKVINILLQSNARQSTLKDIRLAVRGHFDNDLGYGQFYTDANGEILVGFCFIKTPKIRPEITTNTLPEFRNKGIATSLINFALSQRKFHGNVIYAAIAITNPASLKSVIKSGFQIFDVTKDGYIQLIKILPYG